MSRAHSVESRLRYYGVPYIYRRGSYIGHPRYFNNKTDDGFVGHNKKIGSLHRISMIIQILEQYMDAYIGYLYLEIMHKEHYGCRCMDYMK